eukprot:748608-Amphidinium_carterae.1
MLQQGHDSTRAFGAFESASCLATPPQSERHEGTRWGWENGRRPSTDTRTHRACSKRHFSNLISNIASWRLLM